MSAVMRQTIDTVEIPGLGRGLLTWRNGPAHFVADEGGETPRRSAIDKVTDGGSSVSEGSWLNVTIGRHAHRAKLLARGERHDRFYSPLFGDGWLITESTKPGWWQRFETLSDEVKVRFDMVSLCVGRPAYAAKMKRSHTKMPKHDDPDEMSWTTYETASGEVFTFRRGGPLPEVLADDVADERQMVLL